MVKTVSITLVCFIVSSIVVLGQNNDSTAQFEKQRRDDEALVATANANPASKALDRRLASTVVDRERVEILQEAVKTGDRGIIPYLKARRELGLGPAQHLDLALVALGETQYVDNAIEDLKSSAYVIQVDAIWRLARFKTKESYRKLYELLDDETNRATALDTHSIVRTLASVTKDELLATVEDPPKGKDAYDTAAWKAWFAKNKQLIE